MNETTGQIIQRLRKNKGLTQEQLAEMVGVTAQAVSKWENDVTMPDVQTIPLLAKILGVTTDELLGVKTPDSAPPEAEAPQKTCARTRGFKSWIALAIMLILVGIAYILSYSALWPFSPPESIWAVLWPAAVLGVGISVIIHDFSVFSLGISVCGAYYLLHNLNIISYPLSWSAALAIILILLGISIILDKTVFRKKKHGYSFFSCDKATMDTDQSGGSIRMSCSFNTCRIDAERDQTFRHADVDIAFGDGVLNLKNCTAAEDNAEIYAKVAFGDLKIICPSGFKIISASDKAFASVNFKGSPRPDAPHSITINGSVSFGCITVIYE